MVAVDMSELSASREVDTDGGETIGGVSCGCCCCLREYGG